MNDKKISNESETDIPKPKGVSKILGVNIVLLLALVLVIAAYFILPFFRQSSGCICAKNRSSRINLNGMGKAIMLYCSANDDKYPTRPELLVTQGYASTKMFENPSAMGDLKIIEGKFAGEVDYVIFLDDKLRTCFGDSIMGYEKTKFAEKGKVWTLTANGAVKQMTIEELNKQLKTENRPPAE